MSNSNHYCSALKLLSTEVYMSGYNHSSVGWFGLLGGGELKLKFLEYLSLDKKKKKK